MKKSLLVKLAIICLITSALSGCIWAIDDDGGSRGGGHRGGGNHGEHRGDHR